MTIAAPPQVKKKKYLEDIVVLRLLLIFLLIWNHVFAPYSGHWDPIPNQQNIPLYKWLVLVVYNMRIQALIFISGYLLGYTVKRKPESLQFKNCVVKKIKRLLLPSIIFSTFYFIIFYDMTQPIYMSMYQILNGCGHMWFLPMLFWCFVAVFVLERYRVKPFYILMVSVALSIIPCPVLPLRINSAFGNFLYFYIGFSIQRDFFRFLKPSRTLKPILICSAVYVATFLLYYVVIVNLNFHLMTDSMWGGVMY